MLRRDPRGGAAEAEHAAERLEGVAAGDLGAAADRAGEAAEAGARRAGLDRDEGPGEGPRPPLRDGQRLGPRHRALSGRRARGGLPAGGRLQGAEVRAEAPAGLVGAGAFVLLSGRGEHREHLSGHARDAGGGVGTTERDRAVEAESEAQAVIDFLQHDLLAQAEQRGAASGAGQASLARSGPEGGHVAGSGRGSDWRTSSAASNSVEATVRETIRMPPITRSDDTQRRCNIWNGPWSCDGGCKGRRA